MKSLNLAAPGDHVSILCLGAHSDDIEIGAGGTILSLIHAGISLSVTWCVFSACGKREEEAQLSANAFLDGAHKWTVQLGVFQDSYFPSQSATIKDWLIGIRAETSADVVFTHMRDDAHQDHREINQLTWNLFRDHLILEYEIPKWEGDLCRLNTYVPLTREIANKKADLLQSCFATQRSKDWFEPETFRSLARLRGLECRAPEGFAEAFLARKLRLL